MTTEPQEVRMARLEEKLESILRIVTDLSARFETRISKDELAVAMRESQVALSNSVSERNAKIDALAKEVRELKDDVEVLSAKKSTWSIVTTVFALAAGLTTVIMFYELFRK